MANGDSRAYLFRDGVLSRLTPDDSLVQALMDDGRPRSRPTVAALRAEPGDRLLLCSEELSDLVHDATLAAALAEPWRDACADRLVAAALAAGGRDNVSVVVGDAVPRTRADAGWV